MPKIEYRQIQFEGGFGIGDKETIDGLNKIGQEGWVLIQPLPRTSESGYGCRWNGIFSREMEDCKL